MNLPARADIIEIGPRHGLDALASGLAAEQRARLVEHIAAAGVGEIDIATFGAADDRAARGPAVQVTEHLKRRRGVRYAAATLTLPGLAAAIAAKLDRAVLLASASEAYTLEHLNCSVEETFERYRPLVYNASAAGLSLRGVVCCAYACPRAGRLDARAVARVAERLWDAGCDTVTLADDTGAAKPSRVRRLLDAVAHRVPMGRLAVHFGGPDQELAHENLLAALTHGVHTVETALTGLAPAPTACGHHPLETAPTAAFLESHGVRTNLDPTALAQATAFAQTLA